MPLYSDRHIVDDEFRQALHDFSVKPSSGMWHRISGSLNFPGRRSARRIFFIVGLMLIGTSAGVYESIHHSGVKRSTSEPIESEDVKVLASSVVTYPSRDNYSPHSACTMPCDEKVKPVVESREPETYVMVQNDQEIYASLEQNEDRKRESDRLKSIAFKNYQFEEKNLHSKNIKSEPASFIKQPLANCMYVGITASLNNTWLLDEEAISSIHLKYQGTFGGSFGIQSGYHFNDHWGIQAAWLVNSWEGQRYKNIDVYGRTTSLDYTQKSISLNYMHIPVLMQYQIPRYSELLHIPINLNFSLGAQYGRLLSYRIDEIKGEMNNSKIFNRNEIAVVAGADWDFITSDKVFYTLGVRTSLGTSVFNDEMPNYFELSNPHNFLIGIHGAVNFYIER